VRWESASKASATPGRNPKRKKLTNGYLNIVDHDGSIVSTSIAIGIGTPDSPMSLVRVSVKVHFFLCPSTIGILAVAMVVVAASITFVKLFGFKGVRSGSKVKQRVASFTPKASNSCFYFVKQSFNIGKWTRGALHGGLQEVPILTEISVVEWGFVLHFALGGEYALNLAGIDSLLLGTGKSSTMRSRYEPMRYPKERQSRSSILTILLDNLRRVCLEECVQDSFGSIARAGIQEWRFLVAIHDAGRLGAFARQEFYHFIAASPSRKVQRSPSFAISFGRIIGRRTIENLCQHIERCRTPPTRIVDSRITVHIDMLQFIASNGTVSFLEQSAAKVPTFEIDRSKQ
jgi:hypothetical protein